MKISTNFSFLEGVKVSKTTIVNESVAVNISCNEIYQAESLSEVMQTAIGFVISVFSILGVLCSILLMKIVLSKRKFLNTSSMFIPALLVLNLMVSGLIMPFNVATAFNKNVILDENECKLYGFAITWIGFMSISFMTALVVQSYKLICFSNLPKVRSEMKCFYKLLIGCVVLSGIAAAFPLFGIAAYEPYKRPSLCHMRWASSSLIANVYYIAILILFFVVPSIVVTTLYAIIYMKANESSKKCSNSRNRVIPMLKTFVVISGTFILAWTPYVVCVIMDLLGIDYHSNNVYLMSSMVAKVSLTVIPILLLIQHREFKRELESVASDVIDKIERRTTSSGEYAVDCMKGNKHEYNPGEMDSGPVQLISFIQLNK